MLNATIRQVGLHLLVYCSRDPKNCHEVLRLFWDLKYLHMFGIVIDPPPLSDLIADLPESSMSSALINRRLAIHEELLFELVEVIAGNPSPQSSVFSTLNNQSIRLDAAQRLAKRLGTALDQVKAEIEYLNRGSSVS